MAEPAAADLSLAAPEGGRQAERPDGDVGRPARSYESRSRGVGDRPSLILPVAAWFVGFLVAPLVLVTVYSLAHRGPYGTIEFTATLENYARAFDWIYLRILWNSIRLALITSASCLILGYPLAYVMATASSKMRSILLTLVVIPFWTNLVVRAYAIKVLLSEAGPINQIALALGLLKEPVSFGNSSVAVWIGMVTNYLPFMVLPLYVALEKFDFSLIEAARDLGATGWSIFWKILVPLTRPGIVTGMIFVFTPALGEFVIPDLLGGARTMLIGNLITDQFLKSRDWPFGSALSMLLILSVTVTLVFYLWTSSAELARTKPQPGATEGELAASHGGAVT